MADLYDANYTNGTWTYEFQDELVTEQILTLIWMLISTVPNIVLMYLILKNGLAGNNLHFVIFNFTIANMLLIFIEMPLSVIPEINLSAGMDVSIILIDSIVRATTVIYATFFVYDKFIKSHKFCKYLVYTTWIISLLLAITVIMCIYWRFWSLYALMFYVAPLKIIAILLLITKSIVYCVRGSDEQSYRLRSVIAANYSVTNCIQWFYIQGFQTSVYDHVIKALLVVLYYGNGFINLTLLACYDPSIRRYFYQLFGNQIQYLNVHFSRKKPEVTSVLQKNEVPTVEG